MNPGSVLSIHLKVESGTPLHSVERVRAVAGKGLEGDRHFGTDKPHQQVTLIESEALEALRRDGKIELASGESRRNVVTRDVALNHLVGREFRVGEVRLRGIKLCEPCAHLEEMTQKKGVLSGLIHRGGLRAQILTDGWIGVGDPVVTSPL